MEQKINIAELLRDCPKGMELDCTMFDDVYFDCIDQEYGFIKCYIQDSDCKTSISFTEYGCYTGMEKSKCVIFPKGKTTWEGFQRPFKDGDILAYSINSTKSTIFIYRYDNPRWNTSYFVALSGYSRGLLTDAAGALSSYNSNVRFATEEEKQKLFDAIRANGYKWNPETKTLEELIEPKFKVGDKIKKKKEYISGIITDINDGTYRVEYKSGGVAFANIEFQDDWELVPDKFDISTLVPFDKVLVRCSSLEKWDIEFFKKYNRDSNAKYPFICLCNNKYNQCVPFEGNEYLLDTTNDCDDYYKTW